MGIRSEDVQYLQGTIESMVLAAQLGLVNGREEHEMINQAFHHGQKSKLEEDDALAMFCVAMIMWARERVGRG
jgi:hypothetical protein